MLNKIEKFVFYLLIFCLPFQTRKIVYQFSAEFNEWAAAYLYLTDLLVLLLFVCWLWRNRKNRFFQQIKSFSEQVKTPYFWLLGFLFITLLSLVNVRNLGLGFYHWLKLIELVGLFFYLAFNFRLFKLDKIAVVFIVSGIFQTLITWLQFANQKSLGLWFLMESPLSEGIDGVAKVSVQGLEIIRGYGLFPHPNVLAAFLLVGILFCYYLWLRKPVSKLKNTFLFVSSCLLISGLLFSFSRSVIIVFLLASLGFFLAVLAAAKKQKDGNRLKKSFGLMCLFVCYGALISYLAWPELSSRFTLSISEQAVSLRLSYGDFAWQLISHYPLLGVGWGGFVQELQFFWDLMSSWTHQPVHNIYLLIAVQSGLISLIVFLLFIFYLTRQVMKSYFFLILFFSLLLLGLFDHYLFTLQQGQLLFWIILGMGAGWLKEKAPRPFFKKTGQGAGISFRRNNGRPVGS